MEFEDMTIIWGSQNEEPLYALNKKGLQKMLHEKRRAFNRKMLCQELQTYGATFMVIGVITFFLFGHYSGLFQNRSQATSLTSLDVVLLFVAAAGWLHFAYSVLSNRRKQAHHRNAYTANLTDDLVRDISDVDYQIQFRRHIAIRYIPPYFGSLIIFMTSLRLAGQPIWLLIPMTTVLITVLLIEARSQKKLVQDQILPRKLELESLLAKLAAERA